MTWTLNGNIPLFSLFKVGPSSSDIIFDSSIYILCIENVILIIEDFQRMWGGG